MSTKGKVFRIVFSLLILFGQEASCNVFTVVNTFDNVLGSLRRAMLNSNAVPGKDTIDFNIPGSQWQIVLLTELPIITDSVFVDGLSQPGSSFASSNLVEIVGNANLEFGIDIRAFNVTIGGLKIKNFTDGSAFFQSSSNYNEIGDIVIDYVIVDSCQQSIYITQTSVNGLRISNCFFSNWGQRSIIIELQGNSEDLEFSSNYFLGDSLNTMQAIVLFSGYLHTDSTIRINIFDNVFDDVKYAIGVNLGGICEFINIESNSFYNIGYSSINMFADVIESARIKHAAIHGNLIDSTCLGYGISFGSGHESVRMDSVSVFNNFVESKGAQGITFQGNSWFNDTCKFTNISIHDNVIKNSYDGIRYTLRVTDSTYVLSNIDAKRNEISNCTQNGISIDVRTSGSNNLGSKVRFLSIDSNYIHNNGQNGVYFDAWNSFGFLTLKDVKLKGNVISQNGGDGIKMYSYKVNYEGLKFTQNSIFDNGRMGILEFDVNNLYSYGKPRIPAPQFDSLLYNGSKGDLYGHLQSLPNRVYKIEFFSSVNIDSTGYGEGETYLFTRRVVTDSTGYVNFHFSLPQSSIGLYISSTATDSLINHTSEFSNAINNIISGVNDIEDGINSFTVFPNPANKYTTIQRVDVSSETQLALFDIAGRIVKTIWFPKGLGQVHLYVNSIEEGMYVLRNMKAKNNEIGVKLIVAKP
jgi:Secretion system C-terminal sorting domain